jgi:hypothetical protein
MSGTSGRTTNKITRGRIDRISEEEILVDYVNLRNEVQEEVYMDYGPLY